MLLLVDGYNVTMRDPGSSGLSKQDQRELLLARLRVHAHRLAPGGEIVVVFDAHDALGTLSDSARPVRAIFARVADDEIARRCASARGKVAVVTDDLRLRARISQDVGRGVEYRDASTVFSGSLKSASEPAKRTPRDIGLPRGANAITEELKDLWLDEDD